MELQKLVKNMVVERGVVVEVNPSSNVTIGHMDTLHEHPDYHLSHQICDYESLLVCINSDDSGVFNTNAVNEFGVAYFGMIEQGVGGKPALNGLSGFGKQVCSAVLFEERIRMSSFYMNWTGWWSASPDCIVRNRNTILTLLLSSGADVAKPWNVVSDAVNGKQIICVPSPIKYGLNRT